MQKEALYINRSLSFLEQAILALADRRREHVPFRQSKLTHALKDSLGQFGTNSQICIRPKVYMHIYTGTVYIFNIKKRLTIDLGAWIWGLKHSDVVMTLANHVFMKLTL